jgi:hypothetical protein
MDEKQSQNKEAVFKKISQEDEEDKNAKESSAETSIIHQNQRTLQGQDLSRQDIGAPTAFSTQGHEHGMSHFSTQSMSTATSFDNNDVFASELNKFFKMVQKMSEYPPELLKSLRQNQVYCDAIQSK